MKFETSGDCADPRRERSPANCGWPLPEQAAADVADVYERAWRSPRRGVLAEANLAHLTGSADRSDQPGRK
jgi:hypothetical protein